MDREKFAQKLKEARTAANLTQKDVANIIKRPQQTIAAWEVGRSQPDMDTLSKLLQLYHTSANAFFEYQSSFDFKVTSDEAEYIKKYRTLDQYGKDTVNIILDREYERSIQAPGLLDNNLNEKVLRLFHSELKTSAGTGWELEEEEMEQWKVLWNELTRKADFCVDVAGKSMEPMFYDGDILLIRSQPAVNIGEIGLYIFDGNGYVKRQEDGYIHSLNPEYKDIFPTEECSIECKGLVLGILKPEWIVEK